MRHPPLRSVSHWPPQQGVLLRCRTARVTAHAEWASRHCTLPLESHQAAGMIDGSCSSDSPRPQHPCPVHPCRCLVIPSPNRARRYVRILFEGAERYAHLSCSGGPAQLRAYPSFMCRGTQTQPPGANTTLQVLVRAGRAVRTGPRASAGVVGQVARCAKVVSAPSTRVVDAAGDGCCWVRALYSGRLRWMADKCGGVALAKPSTSTACREPWLAAAQADAVLGERPARCPEESCTFLLRCVWSTLPSNKARACPKQSARTVGDVTLLLSSFTIRPSTHTGLIAPLSALVDAAWLRKAAVSLRLVSFWGRAGAASGRLEAQLDDGQWCAAWMAARALGHVCTRQRLRTTKAETDFGGRTVGTHVPATRHALGSQPLLAAAVPVHIALLHPLLKPFTPLLRSSQPTPSQLSRGSVCATGWGGAGTNNAKVRGGASLAACDDIAWRRPQQS